MEADGSDYRGTVSQTRGGLTCQMWSHQYPHEHQKSHSNFPKAGLGGHNSCRNPDGDMAPWCHTVAEAPVWDYCTVPPPSRVPCNTTLPVSVSRNSTRIALKTFAYASVEENRYQWFEAVIPPDAYYLKAVVVPLTGDPNLFVSFDTPFPTGANYTVREAIRLTASPLRFSPLSPLLLCCRNRALAVYAGGQWGSCLRDWPVQLPVLRGGGQ